MIAVEKYIYILSSVRKYLIEVDNFFASVVFFNFNLLF